MVAGKTVANQSFQSFGKENVDEFKILANLSGSEIWLGKILANDVCFAKFAQNILPPSFYVIQYS